MQNKLLVEANPWLKNITKYGTVKSIDPFHFFTSFSQFGEKETKRISIINQYFKILESDAHFNKIDFTGCPTPFALRILSVRDIPVQKQIWSFFKDVADKNQSANIEEMFNNLSGWYGIDVSSLSIFLFWVDARNFMSLDKNSEIFLLELGILQGRVRNALDYRKLLKVKDSEIYIEIAKQAVAINSQTANAKKIAAIVNTFSKKKAASTTKFEFKIIALEPINPIQKEYVKNLHTGEIYSFYKDYKFRKNGRVAYIANKNKPDIYSSAKIEINVSAIVGKNGSGKSTLSELLFMAINNIAASTVTGFKLEPQPRLYLNLYYHSGSLHKIELRDKAVNIVEYLYKNDQYLPGKPRRMAPSDLDAFFYTVAINYSHYGLNSKDMGPWIDELFHKNDGYQTPLVLNPYREKGNINVNREADLVKQRLLSNILEKIRLKDKNNIRVLTDNGRMAETLIFKINQQKRDELYNEKIKNEQKILSAIKAHYKLTFGVSKRDLIPFAKKYLVAKLVKIANGYLKYNIYIDKKGHIKMSTLPTFLRDLEADNSHITSKFRQAVNFFKYDTCKPIRINAVTTIEQLSQKIDVIKSRASRDRKLETIELLPPAFLEFDIFLSDKSNLKDLSSGEKQKLYAVSTLIYHLNNLDSVLSNRNFVSYPFVNIILDEIELYFHPDMQRTFIAYLSKYLEKTTFNNLIAINFCFITHSPFILSDIPNDNILYLNEKGMPDNSLNEEKTFAGNIHELLGNNFYLEKGYMGEFSADKVRSAVHFLHKQISGDAMNENKKWNKENLSQFIEMIGEPLLRDSLKEMHRLAFSGKANQETN
ncbi:MAG: hypothetical protein ABIN36_13225 [Ferruginibacter sp.]